jgi:hypothetical protein
LLFAAVLLMVFMIPHPAKAVGVRTEDLIIRFYSNVENAYAALKAGDIDAVGYEITSDLYADAITDPNIGVAPVGDQGKYEFDINNNYTATALNDGRRSPTSYLEFRRGFAYCVDKDLVVGTFCGGFADRIDQPLAYLHRGWRNQSYWYEDGTYPYEFNLVSASAAFDAAGFVQGTDANPDYDAGIPGSVPNLRIHPDKGTTMNNLEVCSRTDDTRRHQAGLAAVENLRLCGIPVNHVEADSSVLYPKVMDNFDYHIYTGGWNLGRFPAITAYGLYHWSQYFLGGSNYVTGNDSANNPAHPILDAYLYGARYPDSYSEAQTYARLAFGQHVEECVTVELFAAKSFWCWSKDLKGIVNAEGQGLENGYTFLNAYKSAGDPGIKYGIKTPPNAMNKIYSQWYYDYQCLDRMDLYGGIDVPPYDQSVDQSGYILGWTTTTWVDPDDSVTKTLTQQAYRDDAFFVEPVTGNQLEAVNITHHFASIWYERQLTDAWNHDGVADIKFVDITGTHSYDIYWDVTSYWNTYLGATSIKSFNWWSKGTLSQTVTDNDLVPDGDGYIGCTAPVFWVLSITGDGAPLTLGTDYNIYGDPDGPHEADVRIISGSYTDVDITYLATNDAEGYYPAGLPWADGWEGAGMYYATDFSPGAGGYCTLKKSSFYPIESVPLGEIDYIKKGNGCYKIDIFDVVIAASAYGSQGEYVPSVNWFPGADLAPEGVKVDIFDIVTITGKYGTEWDCP